MILPNINASDPHQVDFALRLLDEKLSELYAVHGAVNFRASPTAQSLADTSTEIPRFDQIVSPASFVPSTRTLTAGAGLTGGGDLSVDRTFSVGAGTGITVNANDIAISDTAVTPGAYTVTNLTVDQQGRITAASNGLGSVTVDRLTDGIVNFILNDSTANLRGQATQTTLDAEDPAGVRRMQFSIGNTGLVDEVQMFIVPESFRFWNTNDFAQGADHRSVYMESSYDATTAGWTAETLVHVAGVDQGATSILSGSSTTGGEIELAARFQSNSTQFILDGTNQTALGLTDVRARLIGDGNDRLAIGDAGSIAFGLGVGGNILTFTSGTISSNAGALRITCLDTPAGDSYEAFHQLDNTGISSFGMDTTVGGVRYYATIEAFADTFGPNAYARFNTYENAAPASMFSLGGTSGAAMLSSDDKVFYFRAGQQRWALAADGASYQRGHFHAGTTEDLGWANLLCSNTVQGIWFRTGATANELLWRSGQSTSFGWQMRQDESGTGDLFIDRNGSGVAGTYTQCVRFQRGTGELVCGTGASWLSGFQGTIYAEGQLSSRRGVHFNYDQRNNTLGGDFKWSSVSNVYMLYGSATDNGVAIGSTATTGGNLTYAAGRTSTNKAGTNMVTSSVADNLIQWQSTSDYHNAAGGHYGWGWMQEEVSYGDTWLFNKNGGPADDTTVIYCKRSNQFVGIGGGWTGASPPLFALDVAGTFHFSSTATFGGTMTIADGANFVINTGTGSKFATGTTQKMGWWNASPVAQSTGWTTSNVTSDKVIDANSTSIDEVADVLCTLIEQLKTYGLLGA